MSSGSAEDGSKEGVCFPLNPGSPYHLTVTVANTARLSTLFPPSPPLPPPLWPSHHPPRPDPPIPPRLPLTSPAAVGPPVLPVRSVSFPTAIRDFHSYHRVASASTWEYHTISTTRHGSACVRVHLQCPGWDVWVEGIVELWLERDVGGRFRTGSGGEAIFGGSGGSGGREGGRRDNGWRSEGAILGWSRSLLFCHAAEFR